MRYQQIFDQAVGQAPPTTIDIDQVVRKQRRAVTTRAAVATLAAVLVVAAGAGTANQMTAGGEEPPWLESAAPTADFPEYAEGARVIAAAAAPMADRSLALTFTPTSPDLVLFTACTLDSNGDVPVVHYADLALGDATTSAAVQSADNGFCTLPAAGYTEAGEIDSVLSPEGGQNWDGWEEFWAEIQVGQPATITVTLVDAAPIAGGAESSIPSVGTFALAVAERVSFEEYEFPPRPAELAPLPAVPEGDLLLKADPDDPNRPVEATFPWLAGVGWCGEDVLPLGLLSQTPGSLRVLVDGVEVAQQTWWDYGQSGGAYPLAKACGPDLGGEFEDGEMVTIVVEPEHMTGDWQVVVSRNG